MPSYQGAIPQIDLFQLLTKRREKMWYQYESVYGPFNKCSVRQIYSYLLTTRTLAVMSPLASAAVYSIDSRLYADITAPAAAYSLL